MKQLRYSTTVRRGVATALMAALTLIGSYTLMAQEVSREYSREFRASKDVTVEIDNSYGNVNIEIWDEERVEIVVRVIADMADRERSERVIEMIDIEFIESGSKVGARTILARRLASATRGSEGRFSIEYFVKLPGDIPIDITNRYGNIALAEHSGQVTVNLRYGNLHATALTRGNERPVNHISLLYGDAFIEEANWLSVYTRYSKSFVAGSVQALLADSRYSSFRIENIGSMVAETNYDDFRITRINNIIADGSYSVYRLGTITGRIGLNARYGSFTAENLQRGFERVDIEVSYCNIVLPVDRSAQYSMDVRVRYGSVRYCEECIEVESDSRDGRSRQIVGVAGDGSSQAEINIVSSYSSIRLR